MISEMFSSQYGNFVALFPQKSFVLCEFSFAKEKTLIRSLISNQSPKNHNLEAASGMVFL